MSNQTGPKPCGNYHYQKCGQSTNCKVPFGHFDLDKTSQEIYEEWKDSHD